MQKTRMAVAAAAALAMLVAAGCGSSGNGAEGGSGSASGNSASSASASGSAASSASASGSAASSASSASGASGSASSASGSSGSASSASGASGSASSASGASGSASGASSSGGDDNFTCNGKSGSEVPTKLVLSLVPSGDSQKLVDSAKPLEKYLTETLGIPVEGNVSTDYAGAVEALGADQVQIGMFAPLPMIQACQKYGAKIVLQSVRFGSSTYHTQFMTNNPDKYCTISKPVAKKANKDYLNCNGTADKTTGPIALDTLSKLKGAKVALLDPGSTSGYIFPSLAMINAGVDPTKDIQVVQLESHDQSVLAVYNGDAEVGVSYDDARDAVVKDKPDVGKKVVVFAYSDEIPNDGVVVSGKLTSDWQAKITKALSDYAKSPAGKKVLGDIYQIDDFAPAVPASLGKVAEAVQKLGLGG